MEWTINLTHYKIGFFWHVEMIEQMKVEDEAEEG